MMKEDRNDVEILYVAGSSRDRKGKRVLVREGEVENYLWPGERLSAIELKLLGISGHQEKQIRAFLEDRQRRSEFPGSFKSITRGP